MAIVRLVCAATMILLGSLTMGQALPDPCPAKSPASSKTQNAKPNATGGKNSQNSDDPCRNTNSQTKPAATSETVSWDPMTDTGGKTSDEIVSWFVLGLLISAPVFLVVRRLKSRKNESLPAKKILE
jgi:hypothetical protein